MGQTKMKRNSLTERTKDTDSIGASILRASPLVEAKGGHFGTIDIKYKQSSSSILSRIIH